VKGKEGGGREKGESGAEWNTEISSIGRKNEHHQRATKIIWSMAQNSYNSRNMLQLFTKQVAQKKKS